MKHSNLELLEVIERQQELIKQQHQTIVHLVNENAEQEQILNEALSE